MKTSIPVMSLEGAREVAAAINNNTAALQAIVVCEPDGTYSVSIEPLKG